MTKVKNIIFLTGVVFCCLTGVAYAGEVESWAPLSRVLSKAVTVFEGKIVSARIDGTRSERIATIIAESEGIIVGKSLSSEKIKCRYNEVMPNGNSLALYTGSRLEFRCKPGESMIFLLASQPTENSGANLLRIETPDKKELIINLYAQIRAHRRKMKQLPRSLRSMYKKFSDTMYTGDIDSIKKYCLPGAISFTSGKRKNKELGMAYGPGINNFFVKNGFSSYIVKMKKDGKGCYLIRTNTSTMWFIETKATGWKLYKYFDKPI